MGLVRRDAVRGNRSSGRSSRGSTSPARSSSATHPATTTDRMPPHSSDSDSESDWSYLTVIKWIVFALILSLGSVFILDLVKSAIFPQSTFTTTDNNNNHVQSPVFKPILPNDNVLLDNEPVPINKQYYEDFIQKMTNSKGNKLSPELRIWLKENQLDKYSNLLEEIGKSHSTLCPTENRTLEVPIEIC